MGTKRRLENALFPGAARRWHAGVKLDGLLLFRRQDMLHGPRWYASSFPSCVSSRCLSAYTSCTVPCVICALERRRRRKLGRSRVSHTALARLILHLCLGLSSPYLCAATNTVSDQSYNSSPGEFNGGYTFQTF